MHLFKKCENQIWALNLGHRNYDRLVFSMIKSSIKHTQIRTDKKDSLPILRELMGKYWVTGFLTTRKSFSRFPTALILNFCSSCTAMILKSVRERERVHGQKRKLIVVDDT